MTALRCVGIAASSLVLVAPSARSQTAPPIRQLGAVVATSLDTIGDARSIRPLSDGRVLVNDNRGQRLLLLDASLQHATVVADTTEATQRAYGKGLLGLTRFGGDSSLVLDQITRAYLVIDPSGKVARVIPAPGRTPGRISLPANDVMNGPPNDYDQAGHLLFVAPDPVFIRLLPEGFVGDTLMHWPDSTAIVRERLGERGIDTVVSLQAARNRQAVTRRDGRSVGRRAVNPISSSDDWTVLDDGTIAVIRMRDYHVDWVTPDRHIRSGPKIPTQWVRITDSMKVAIMDSVRAVRSADAARGTGPNAATNPAPPAFVEPTDLPDYRPPFTPGFTRADAENRVWVRESQSLPAVYDVIDRSGHLADRVQLPAGTTLVGFGPGAVYVTAVAQGRVMLRKMTLDHRP